MPLAKKLSEQQLADIIELFDETDFGMAIVDAEGSLVGVNEPLAELFGYESEELLGQPAETFWQGFRRHYRHHLFFMNLAERKNWQGELLCKNRNGTIFPVQISWLFHPRHEGTAIGIFKDLTEQKRWESQILEARDRAERYLDISQAMIVALNLEGNVQEINRRGCEILGYEQSDLLGQNWFDLAIPDEQRREEIALFRKILSKQDAPPNSLESEVVTANGEVRYILWHHSLIENEHGEIQGTLSSGQDISRRKQAEQEIYRLAMTDHLTGLLNRRSFYERFEEHLKLASRNNLNVACIAIDLDRFKPVNDQYGHEMGDKVLVQVARTLTDNFRDTDSIGRLGGDEFAVIAVLSNNHNGMEDSLARLLQSLSAPMHIDGKEISIGASIGVAYYPDDSDSLEDLMHKADSALYLAKNAGRNRIEPFRPKED